MARFGLSTPSPPKPSSDRRKKLVRFHSDYDSDSDATDSISSSEEEVFAARRSHNSNEEPLVSSDSSESDSDSEDDYPHPLGFSNRFGLSCRRRQSSSPLPSVSVNLPSRSAEPQTQTQPQPQPHPSQGETTEDSKPKIWSGLTFENPQQTSTFLKFHYQSMHHGQESSQQQQQHQHPRQQMQEFMSFQKPPSISKLTVDMSNLNRSNLEFYEQQTKEYLEANRQAELKSQERKAKMAAQHAKETKLLLDLIHSEQEEAKEIEAYNQHLDQLQKDAVEEQDRQLQKQKKEREREIQEKKDIADQNRRQEEETAKHIIQKQEERAQAVEAKKKEIEADKERKFYYVKNSQKKVDTLNGAREKLQIFDTSKEKPISKRRLQMKKIARGKMNTLSNELKKVEDVTLDIINAIKDQRAQDSAFRQQLESGTMRVTKDMSRGTIYFIDLISSSLVARVKADGFNGTRGDGFPLAHMMAHVSTQVPKEFIFFVEAHIYRMCKTTIPMLPTPNPECSEIELMQSLGMQMDMDGNYETFEKFLSRTESFISIMAEIMCSSPDGHNLLGGHKGAMQWLERFLDLLPSDQSPLPLLTAPILVAFLTAAGHMLVNTYPDNFLPLLKQITDDISKRLDTSPIGAPSATRLSKILSGGIEEMKSKLPQGAIAGLYHVGTPSHVASLSGQSGSLPVEQTSFSGTTNSAPGTNPFGTSTNAASAPSPFGTTINAPSPSPFGNTANAAVSSPFATANAPAPSPFGTATNASAQSSFGSTTNVPTASPFGSTTNAPVTSPFGSTTNAPVTSPFGSTTNAPVTSPFGTTNIPVASPFGTNALAPSPFATTPGPVPISGFGATNIPSPFGTTTNPPAPSPFGVTTSAPATSPFGVTTSAAPSTFGTANEPVPSPFGTTTHIPAPSPFGITTTASSPSPFGGAFGTPSAPTPSPFGTATNVPVPAPSPFGMTNSAPAPSPFGASPFGTATTCPPATTPFGASSNQTQFGQTQQANPFGGTTAEQDTRLVCKFFLQGRCNKGDRCRFSHVVPAGNGNAQNQSTSSFGAGPAPAPTPFGGGGSSRGGGNSGGTRQLCRFFAQGTCRNGDNCRFSHELPAGSTASTGQNGGW